jgi:endo-1,4-beta-xylanase
MQGHLNLNSPSIEDYEKSIQEFADLGVKIMITELDLSVLPSVRSNDGANVKSTFEYNEKINPYKDGLSKEVEEKQYQRYTDFFKLFVKYQDNIDRVTLWGVNDAQSWKNDWPVEGRTDYTLLFDRNNKPKEVVKDIINIVSNNN